MLTATKKALWFQCLASLLMLSPLLYFNLATFVGNSDALFYTIVLKLLANNMAQGHWLPHWLPEANGGSGSTVMLFYNPLAYYISAIIGAPLAAIDPLGWKRLVLGMFVAQWAAGFFTYLWLSRRFSSSVALAASLFFTLFPYKFAYIFLHINLAQLWALVWLPLLMMSAEDMAMQKPKAAVWYALYLALLMLTHPRTVIAFAAVPAFYALIFSTQRWRTMLQLLVAHGLAVGIAAFYLLPAILNIHLVHTEFSMVGQFNYASNLSHYDLLLNFHYAVIAALCFGLSLRLPILRHSRYGREMWFYIVAFLIVTLLCLRLSQPLWDVFPPLQFLQFPVARLHVVALIAATWMSAFFLSHIGEIKDTRWLYSPAALLLPIAIMAVVTLHHINDVIYASPNDLDWQYIETTHQQNTILPAEYQLRDPAAALPPVFIGEKEGVFFSLLSFAITVLLLCGCKRPPPPLRFGHEQNN